MEILDGDKLTGVSDLSQGAIEGAQILKKDPI
jgi:hypothetical protein